MENSLKLSTIERWMLSNQYRIMELLTKDTNEKKAYKQAQDVLSYGYEYLYSEISQNIHSEEHGLTETEGRKVLDILYMYNEISYSYDVLADKSGIENVHVQFPGFSGTEETSYMGFACFYCCSFQDGHFPELKAKLWRPGIEGFDSKAPFLEIYERMLAVWNPIKQKLHGRTSLSKQEIIAIINQRLPPDAQIQHNDQKP